MMRTVLAMMSSLVSENLESVYVAKRQIQFRVVNPYYNTVCVNLHVSKRCWDWVNLIHLHWTGQVYARGPRQCWLFDGCAESPGPQVYRSSHLPAADTRRDTALDADLSSWTHSLSGSKLRMSTWWGVISTHKMCNCTLTLQQSGVYIVIEYLTLSFSNYPNRS